MPNLTIDEKICRLIVFSYPSLTPIRTYKFRSEPIWNLYNTNEVVNALPDEDEDMDIFRKAENQTMPKTKDLDDLEQEEIDLQEDD